MEEKSYHSIPLIGTYRENDALTLYNEVKKHNDFVNFMRLYMRRGLSCGQKCPVVYDKGYR